MEIRVVLYDVLHEYNHTSESERIEFVTNFDNDTTLEEIFESAGHPYADLSEYYYLSGAFSFNTRSLPFIINSSGRIDWNISYQEAKIIDFIATHHIKNNVITAKIGLIQTGGAGSIDLIDIWNLVYPVLDQIKTIFELGAASITMGKWVHSLFHNKDIPPQSYFDLIFSRSNWNHFDLAELIDISPDNARNLLKAFGYIYDKNKHMYVQQSSSLELREKISKINVLKI